MKYTLDTLKKINERFIESHRMKESDVEMANAYGCEHTEPRYSKDTARISLWYGLGETLLILCHQMSMTIWIFQKTPS